MAVTLFFLLCLATLCCTVSGDLLSEYAHHAVLDAAEKVKLFWTVSWDSETVSFALEAHTTGWVGLGFSTTSGRMVGSDLVIGWVKDNKGYLTDRYADSKDVPPIDEQQDYVLTDSKESDGKTLLKFTRKFDTCDPRDRKLIIGAIKVLFAYHSEDPVSPMEMKQHEFRGAKSILLLSSVSPGNSNETGWKKFYFTTQNITIPGNKSTTCWCTLIKGPELKSKHHVTKFVSHIQEGNEGLVHHVVLYECYGNFSKEHLNGGVDCDSQANMPYQDCRFKYSMVAVLPIGEQGLNYPPHVGYPIGESKSPKYFLLETHYENPRLVKDRKDSSGLIFYYTDKVRKYDAGIVAVGIQVNPWHVIPPKQKNWISVGYCMHQCTESLFNNTGLPEGGINVFASGPHAHVAARATWTKHIRNGTELPEISRDDHYHFNFQYLQMLRKEINIQPGDDLAHYCRYNSMDRDRPIIGGGSTYDEMCLDYLYYYPRIEKFTFCDNTLFEPSWKLIDKLFPITNDGISQRYWRPLPAWNINWTDEVANDFRRYQSELDTLIPGCWTKRTLLPSDLRGPLPNRRAPLPKITEPLPPEEPCRVQSPTTQTKSGSPIETKSGADMTSSFVLFVGVMSVIIQASI